MPRAKVLYICHNHPSVRPGGAEVYALELYHAMQSSPSFEPILLAKGGPPISTRTRPHEGTLLGRVNQDPNQYFLYTEAVDYDWFYGTSPNKEIYAKFSREFLKVYRPDVVHVQHTLFFGYDILREIRNSLPDVPIVYTLHEFLPICHRNGQMVRTMDDEPCLTSSPTRCHECFPDKSPQAFFMRKQFIQSHLSLVDLFLAPSQFLLERYVEWGIPRNKIRFEEYGRSPVQPLAAAPRERSSTRFGFFGQLNPFKGIEQVLQAMVKLREPATAPEESIRKPAPLAARVPAAPPAVPNGITQAGADDAKRPHLWVHGANLDLQPSDFRNRIKALLETTKDDVTFVGTYKPDEVPRLMANIDWVIVPSIWWENSPLVIQEAFQHGRPVIASGIGGMAEKVAHGVNGLHFRAGDTDSLSETMREAAASPGLWDKLREGIPQVYRMDEHVAVLSDLYSQLIS
jgi:glycosyltransferase involved in cell wall biosynthesis